MWSLKKKIEFLVSDQYFLANMILGRRENKPNKVENIFDILRYLEEMWKDPGDKQQRPIEQIITEAMTDNNIHNRRCHYRNVIYSKAAILSRENNSSH